MAKDLSTVAGLGNDVDDSGTDTLQRFAYQAKVIFPFVLRCAQGGDETAVVPEHIEDCFLQRKSGIAFLQIKSRDAGRGGWTLNELLGSGGALKSLYRAFSQDPQAEATYVAMLEQSLSRSNDSVLLRSPEGRSSALLIGKLAKAFDITKAKARIFLQKIRIRDSLTPRDAIDAVNLRLLHAAVPHWTLSKVEQVYQNALTQILAAMRAESIGVEWPQYTCIEDGADEVLKKRFTAKKLNQTRCREMLSGLSTKVTNALTRELDPSLPAPSNLERKLLVGGADTQIIANAKELRARALTIEIERMVGDSGDGKQSDVVDHALLEIQKKLKWHSVAANAKYSKDKIPANSIWNELLNEFPKQSVTLDPHGVFAQDGYLLLGELCELSDQCMANWGEIGA